MGTLNKRLIVHAFEALGRELRDAVELLVVGGSAGVLTGELPEAWTTSDVDTVEFRPPDQVEEVLRAAAIVARRLSLPANWLNTDAGLYRHDLPKEWESRCVKVGTFGKLSVRALGRRDFIAVKFYAHRPVDRVHLQALKVSRAALNFVRQYLQERTPDDASKAAMALAYVDAWDVSI